MEMPFARASGTMSVSLEHIPLSLLSLPTLSMLDFIPGIKFLRNTRTKRTTRWLQLSTDKLWQQFGLPLSMYLSVTTNARFTWSTLSWFSHLADFGLSQRSTVSNPQPVWGTLIIAGYSSPTVLTQPYRLILIRPGQTSGRGRADINRASIAREERVEKTTMISNDGEPTATRRGIRLRRAAGSGRGCCEGLDGQDHSPILPCERFYMPSN